MNNKAHKTLIWKDINISNFKQIVAQKDTLIYHIIRYPICIGGKIQKQY
jgi:hypothetical protein